MFCVQKLIGMITNTAKLYVFFFVSERLASSSLAWLPIVYFKF